MAPGLWPTPRMHHLPYLGCYENDDDCTFLFPVQAVLRLQQNKWEALDCEQECGKCGFWCFRREYRRQCFCFCKNVLDETNDGWILHLHVHLHWEQGYSWQDNSVKKFWCMECQ